MFKTGISQYTNVIVSSLSQKIRTLASFFNSPYAELSKQAQEVVGTLAFALPSKWEYVTEPETGLQILKSEKDPEALKRVNQMAEELFK